MPSSVSDVRQVAISATLRQCQMFASLAPADLAAVAEACTVRSLPKGGLLFREGEKSEGFYVMQSGSVSIFRLTPDGREQIICVFHAPESFAEAAMATVETYPANAMALEPSQVIVVNKSRFRDLIRRQPELSLHMLGSMSVHLKHLVQSLQDIKSRQIEYRLAEWLLRQTPASAPGVTAICELPVTKKVLAGQLGVTSETLSRAFARFRKEKLILVEGARVHLLNPAGLRAYTAV